MDWSIIWSNTDIILAGLWLTVRLSVAGIIGSLIIGVFVGSLHSLPNYVLKKISGTYIEIMRNIPLIVKLFFLYYAVGLDAIAAAITGLIVHQSGFIADVTAAGLRSVPREQLEAAHASGLSVPQTFGHVLLPQALRFVVPPMTSQFIELVKNSALVMLIGLQDLTFVTQNINVETYRYLESFIAVTVLYVAIVLAIVGAMEALERMLRIR